MDEDYTIEQEYDSGVADEYGLTLKDYEAISAQFGTDFREALEKRSDKSCWAMLKRWGHPSAERPNELATWAYLLFRAGAVFTIANGFADLTDKGKASGDAKPIAVEDMPPIDNVLPFNPEGR